MAAPAPTRKTSGAVGRIWRKLRFTKPRYRAAVFVGLTIFAVTTTRQLVADHNVSYGSGQDFVMMSTSQGIGPTHPTKQSLESNPQWTVSAYCLAAFDSARHLHLAGDSSRKKRWLEGCASETEKLANGGDSQLETSP
jgi:hypothetical protein